MGKYIVLYKYSFKGARETPGVCDGGSVAAEIDASCDLGSAREAAPRTPRGPPPPARRPTARARPAAAFPACGVRDSFFVAPAQHDSGWLSRRDKVGAAARHGQTLPIYFGGGRGAAPGCVAESASSCPRPASTPSQHALPACLCARRGSPRMTASTAALPAPRPATATGRTPDEPVHARIGSATY